MRTAVKIFYSLSAISGIVGVYFMFYSLSYGGGGPGPGVGLALFVAFVQGSLLILGATIFFGIGNILVWLDSD